MSSTMSDRLEAPAGPASAPWDGPPVALFWDQSLVWGLICVETLNRLGVPFRLLSAAEISSGRLEDHSLLLVPGGWAAHKARVLGEEGRVEIQHFLLRGGSYLGFCGGAGLALSGPAALSLVPLERMPLEDRLPSASGEVWIEGVHRHPAWKDLPTLLPVSVWWPSQFWGYPLPRSLCLATYRATGRDFRVADLPLSDLTDLDICWEEWERIYGINLQPGRLLGHPAILELRLGRGRLMLSYPHLETPGDHWGNRLFANMLNYLQSRAISNRDRRGSSHHGPESRRTPPDEAAMEVLGRALDEVESLIRFGERHLLWAWRRPWLLGWQRGVRGLEYGSLAVCLRSLHRAVLKIPGRPAQPDPWSEPFQTLEKAVREFCPPARKLLMEEKAAMISGRVRKLGRVNRRVDELRERLFGRRMSHGGLCSSLFDQVDHLLLEALRASLPES
ncbi:MAG: hypothetical protein KBH99_11245 [Syntrophobacteraceae bacterium]|nr:hypothetical protein [Syntrophobacteraceae bacterium]